MDTLNEKWVEKILHALNIKIAPLERKREPYSTQIATLERNGITEGKEYEKLQASDHAILAKLVPLYAERDDVLRPFIEARTISVLALEKAKQEIDDTLAEIGTTNEQITAVKGEITTLAAELVRGGMLEKSALSSPAVKSLGGKIDELERAKGVLQAKARALLKDHHQVIAVADRLIAISQEKIHVSVAGIGSQGPRLIALNVILGVLALYTAIDIMSSLVKTLVLLAPSVAVMLLVYFEIGRSKKNGDFEKKGRPWWYFAMFALLFLIFEGTLEMMFQEPGFILAIILVVEMKLCVWSLDKVAYTKERLESDMKEASAREMKEIFEASERNSAEAERKKNQREQDVRAGLDRLNEEIEDDLIKYGKQK